MYALTGLVINLRPLFPDRTSETTRLVEFPTTAEQRADLDSLAERAAREFDLRGRTETSRDDERISLRFSRLASERELVLAPGAPPSLVERQLGFGSIASRIHQLSGYAGGAGYFLWALLLDVTAVSLLVFAASGVVLWWRLRGDLLGGCLLGASTAWTLFYLVWMSVDP